MTSTRRPLAIAVTLAVILLLAADAAAMRFWWFDITRDGKPTFAGGIGASDRTAPRSVLESALRRGKMQIARGSSLTGEELSGGDFTMEGEIVFHFPELRPVRLSRLRIVHDPEPRESGKDESRYWDWRIHPADASEILRHHQVKTAMTSEELDRPVKDVARSEKSPVLPIAVVAIVALGVACFILLRRQRG
jgi:hypothetical protein